MKKLLTALCVLTVLFVLILSSCSGNGADLTEAETSTAEETVQTREILIAENNKSYFRIVMPDKCSMDVKDAALTVFSSIGGFKTENLELVYDNAEVTGDVGEIVIGNAAREGVENAKALIKMPHDYVITADESRIYIYSDNDTQLIAACSDFAEYLKNDNGRKTLTITGSIYHSYDYPAAGMTVCGTAVQEYSIVYADGSEYEKTVAEELQSLIYENTGYTLSVRSSSESSSEREILIGNCGRGTETKYYTGADKLESGEYAIETAGTKLLCAFTYGGRRSASEKLTELFSQSDIENVLLREMHENLLSSLDGKTVLFLGNSHTYYGNCVTTSRGPTTVDMGWFFQIAKTFGEKVSVVNMTYPGEKLTDLYPRLTELDASWFEKFDAVVVQNAGTANDSTALTYARKIRDLFPADTIFAYVITEYCVRNNQTYTLNAAETLKDEGWLIADWGHTAWDLMDGKVSGMKYSYTVTTFRVNKNDTFHPNPLSGYITALTCYSTLTGKQTEGSSYTFIKTAYLNSYISTYYVNAGDTNIIEIFGDKDEIRRIQAIVDKRCAEVNDR